MQLPSQIPLLFTVLTQYQAILKNGLAFTQQLQLPPGRYRLRLGDTDVVSHRLGTLDMPISIPTQTVKN